MTRYCIAWKLQKARGGGEHTGPLLLHPEFVMERKQPPGTPLTKEEAEAKAQRMNLAKEFLSHHWVIQYKGREWKKINEKSAQAVSSEE